MAQSMRYEDGPDEFVEPTTKKPNLNGDRLNLLLLITLYIIQGFPIGLQIALTLILQSSKKITYEDQALFSMAQWPFFMKILWAPLVDAFYIQKIGRRKSWLLSLQILMGSALLYIGGNIEYWLPESGNPNIKMLAFVFIIVNILTATQDIVVDGWSLTMLKKENLNYAATCNCVGVPLGFFIGSVCFNMLVSEEFNNTYLKTTPGTGGLLSMKSVLIFCGFVSLLLTLLIGLFKKEKDDKSLKGYVRISVLQNYRLLWDILKLRRIRILVLVLLTMRVGSSVVDIVSNMKFIDAGVSKDNIMTITTVVFAIKMVMPFFISKFTTIPNPMCYYLRIIPFKLLWTASFAVLLYFTPNIIRKNGVINVPIYYCIILGVVFVVNEMLNFFLTLTVYAFFCRISDARFGGTYMTLFNTFYFLGFLMSNTFALKLVAVLTFKKCSTDVNNSCSSSTLNDICYASRGSCDTYIDGYYIALVCSTVFGFIWFYVFRNTIKNYKSLSSFHWSVNVKPENAGEAKESCVAS